MESFEPVDPAAAPLIRATCSDIALPNDDSVIVRKRADWRAYGLPGYLEWGMIRSRNYQPFVQRGITDAWALTITFLDGIREYGHAALTNATATFELGRYFMTFDHLLYLGTSYGRIVVNVFFMQLSTEHDVDVIVGDADLLQAVSDYWDLRKDKFATPESTVIIGTGDPDDRYAPKVRAFCEAYNEAPVDSKIELRFW